MAPRSQPFKMGGMQIQGMADGTDNADAVTKGQMDTAIASIDLSTLAPLASPTFTGDPKAPTPSTADNDTSIATTAYVQANLASYAPLASPALTGVPTAPTASADNNSTQIATTAYADAIRTWRIVKKTADQSITNNATLTDDSALQFSMAANKTYAIRASLDVQMGAGGLNIGSNGPASPTRVRVGVALLNPTGTGSLYVGTAYGRVTSFTSAQVAWVLTIDAFVQNGANAGTFAIQFAQSSSNAAATTVSKGSYLEYVEIA